MVAQSKVSKSAAGLSEGTIPKAPKTPMAPKPPKKFVPNYKQLLLLHTCLESVLARPDVSPIEWDVVGKALNRSRGSVSTEYCRLRQAILKSQKGEKEEEVVDSPAKDQKTSETLAPQRMVIDEA
ncbi:uncharacterized protein N7484_009750 [Penicillium longicatenatum]|uniref:uncharacterized protein n=1 Tax=Penicillium longicatenatum TaxID=1561947 RepID=UPI002548E22A|nr:uncharacterized protein N7484_009750 [Penicillium longicatenatum]KAJ5636437.1 hypothetical protein N7484_009750 [Penicillium longicatenatum]